MHINVKTFTTKYQNTPIHGIAVEHDGKHLSVYTDMHKSTNKRVRKMATQPGPLLIDRFKKCLNNIYGEGIALSLCESENPSIESLIDMVFEKEFCEFSYKVDADIMEVESIYMDDITSDDHIKLLNFANECLPDHDKVYKVKVLGNNNELIDLINELVANVDVKAPTYKNEAGDNYSLTFANFGELTSTPSGIKFVPHSKDVYEQAKAIQDVSDDALFNVFIAVFENVFGQTPAAIEPQCFHLAEFETPTVKAACKNEKHSSVRDMTSQPDVRFKLPVTPVLYNCTTLQIEVDAARVVKYHSGIILQDNQYEGEPVIGVIVDFNNPIAGLDNMRAIGNKNPNLPIYILWSSDTGPVLELYNE